MATNLHQRNGGKSVDTREDLGDWQIVTPQNALLALVVIFVLGVVLYHVRPF